MNDDKTRVMPEADVDLLSGYFPWENWNECLWGFTCRSRQNYASTLPRETVDEIMLGVQCEQGGCLCELAFRWHMIAGTPVPRLEVFDSAWPILQAPTFMEVMRELAQMVADNETVTPDGVSALLIAYGFKDQSDRPLDAGEG